jgi:hypothetical protein
MKDDDNDDQQIDALAGMLPADGEDDDDEIDHQDIEVDV